MDHSRLDKGKDPNAEYWKRNGEGKQGRFDDGCRIKYGPPGRYASSLGREVDRQKLVKDGVRNKGEGAT